MWGWTNLPQSPADPWNDSWTFHSTTTAPAVGPLIVELTSNPKLGQSRTQYIVNAQTALNKFLQYRSQVDILIHFDHNVFQEN